MWDEKEAVMGEKGEKEEEREWLMREDVRQLKMGGFLLPRLFSALIGAILLTWRFPRGVYQSGNESLEAIN